jgi:hypothetical protein
METEGSFVQPLVVSLLAFVIIMGGAAAGAGLRKASPDRHLTTDTKESVRLGTGLIATIAALVLGLLIAAASGSFQAQRAHVQQLAADIILIDQLLAQYGPEARPARLQLRQATGPMVERIWRENRSAAANQPPFAAASAGQQAVALLLQLSPRNDVQRTLKDRAIQVTTDMAQTRLLLLEQSGGAIPLPFLVVLIFWLAIIFCSFGLFSDPNPVLFGALIICALSAAGALFLVLEMGEPFSGLMQISPAPLRNALAPL